MTARRISFPAQRFMAGIQSSIMTLSPIESITLTGIPVPPSLNNLFANVSGKGRVKSERYRIWLNAAGHLVNAQRKGARIAGPVTLSFSICEDETRADLGNLEKALTDMLVDLRVIDGDDKRTVRAIDLRWSSVPGVSIVITSVMTGRAAA